MSDVLITGGTGFIGQALLKSLLEDPILDEEHPRRYWVLTRQPAKWSADSHEDVRYVSDLDEIESPNLICTVINLAGESLAAKRWNKQQKQAIIDSRVKTTEKLVNWVKDRSIHLKVWINGSAIGWYGHHAPDTTLTESSNAYPGFSNDLCDAWERAARAVEPYTNRLALLRIGITLESHGGPLEAMLPPFKFGMGGPMGSGNQVWSWIHLQDLVRLIRTIMSDANYHGVINGTAPNPEPQARFAKALGQALNRPSFMPMPGFMAKLVIGEFADEVLLKGQRVLPEKALNNGFEFDYPELEQALGAIFKA